MYVVVWVVVGVFVADAVAQFFVAAVVGVLKVWRDCGFCAFDGVHGSEDGVDCGVAFGGAGHVGDCLGEDDLVLLPGLRRLLRRGPVDRRFRCLRRRGS